MSAPSFRDGGVRQQRIGLAVREAKMQNFLLTHREELIARCKFKVSQRPQRAATEAQLANGVPMFLDQLIRTLAVGGPEAADDSMRISGDSGGISIAPSEIGVSAHAHGHQLLSLGFTVAQVVHDYGDLCQAITELAFALNVPFSIAEFRTLNRCLDNAIAEAVTAFNSQHDAQLSLQHHADTRQQVGFLVHELRNALGTATLAASALEAGGLAVNGATGAVLKRSLAEMNRLMNQALDEVRGSLQAHRSTFNLASFIAVVQSVSALDAGARGHTLQVGAVDPSLRVHGNPELLQAAAVNLLQNAYKFSQPGSEVSLRAYAAGKQVLIEVADRCGGLPQGAVSDMFSPFRQRSGDRSGLGLGLSIARKNIEVDSGTLSVMDVPGIGCVFTISLPLFDEISGCIGSEL